MDRKTLKFLAAGGHMNMPERISLGLWPHPPIPRSELVAAVVEAISEQRWFPHPWLAAKPGEPVVEGGVIERESADRYVYRNQRADPRNPCLPGDSVEVVFGSGEEAAGHYLRFDVDQDNLDGWRIVKLNSI